MDKENTVIGFIGTGVMGKSMAGHLLDAGYQLHVYNRTKSKADELVGKGAVWQNTPAEIARNCNLVITIVGFPNDVEAVYLGPDGIIANAKPGSFLVDMTTSSPELAERIYREAKEKDSHTLDAPVSGGDVGAKEARLSIMVGGDREDYDKLFPIFELMGKNIVYQGKAGSGQHCKMANQITIAANMMGVCEAIAYAEKAGLDPETVLKSISSGAAGSWSLSNLGPRIIAGNFAPGFFVKHFIKDMKIAVESAEHLNLDADALKLALEKYEQLANQGGENDGTQALYKLYE